MNLNLLHKKDDFWTQNKMFALYRISIEISTQFEYLNESRVNWSPTQKSSQNAFH